MKSRSKYKIRCFGRTGSMWWELETNNGSSLATSRSYASRESIQNVVNDLAHHLRGAGCDVIYEYEKK